MDVKEADNDLQWYCLRSRMKQERIAEQCLIRQLGVDAFAPRLKVRRKTRRGPVWFVEALFPGYLFAHFVMDEQSRLVTATMGVAGIVRFGDQIPSLPASAIEELRDAMGADGVAVVEDAFKSGDEVTVAAGPMQGLRGLVRRYIPPAGRVRVLLEFMGRAMEVEVNEAALTPDTPRRLVGSLTTDPAHKK